MFIQGKEIHDSLLITSQDLYNLLCSIEMISSVEDTLDTNKQEDLDRGSLLNDAQNLIQDILNKAVVPVVIDDDDEPSITDDDDIPF